MDISDWTQNWSAEQVTYLQDILDGKVKELQAVMLVFSEVATAAVWGLN